MDKVTKAVSVMVVVGMLAGCATMEMTEEERARLGATMGAIAGALIANEAGASDWQVVLAGIAAGYAGYRIGQYLGQNDQAALQQRTASALSNARDGETIEWASTESSARARITTIGTRQEIKNIELLRDHRVDSPPPLDIIGKLYTSLGSSVNLRAGPSTSTQVVGSLDKGEVVHAFGKVQDAPWVMIGRNDIAMGYVHASLVAEHDPSIAEQTPVLTGTFELDDVDMEEVNREARATFEIDDLVTVGDTVEVTTECRTVKIDIVVDEAAETDNVDACRGPNGGWEAV